eukprot:1186677-Prorocentrum_minimum.AAC.6
MRKRQLCSQLGGVWPGTTGGNARPVRGRLSALLAGGGVLSGQTAARVWGGHHWRPAPGAAADVRVWHAR